jgi:hypothetical protein
LIGVNTLMSAAAGGEDIRSHDHIRRRRRALAMRIGLNPAVATRAAILAAKMGEKVPGAAVADVARVAVRVASEAEQGPTVTYRPHEQTTTKKTKESGSAEPAFFRLPVHATGQSITNGNR